MKTTTLLAAFTSTVTARFAGHLVVTMQDGACRSVAWNAADTGFPFMDCFDTKFCTANGANQIVTASSHCDKSGHYKDTAGYIDVYPHDTLRWCRYPQGLGNDVFCTCMTTHFENIVKNADGSQTVNFSYNDDHAWGCQ